MKDGATCKTLKQGTKFKEIIRFHNLKRVELGALISTITFANGDNCYHSIGLGKPYGYGKTKININKVTINESDVTYHQCYEEFEKRIAQYREKEVLDELQAMARGIPCGREEEFKYMQMDMNGKNDFGNGKKQYGSGEQLGRFTQILSGKIPRNDYNKQLSPNDVRFDKKERVEKMQREKEKERKRLEAEEKSRKAEEEKKALEEKLRKEKELEEQRILQEIEKKKEEEKAAAADAEIQGDNYFNAKEYEKALEYYKKAEAYRVVVDKINKCEKMLALSTGEIIVKTSSFPVCAKDLAAMSPIDNKIPQIAEKMKEKLEKEKSSKKREWKEFKKWKPIVEAVGEENARKLYDIIFG